MTDNMICKQRFFYLSGKAEAPEASLGHEAPPVTHSLVLTSPF